MTGIEAVGDVTIVLTLTVLERVREATGERGAAGLTTDRCAHAGVGADAGVLGVSLCECVGE